MKSYLLSTAFLFVLIGYLGAQDLVPNPRPITMDEYEKAKTFEIKDLDNESYVKFDNTYVLDRYEMRKPIFITGDDGLRKRIDLYKLLAKEDMQELGVMVFYTTEKGKLYKAVLPNFTASGEIWDRYFEDIHAIDKVEKNFVLKLSYVLSREFSFQLYKAINQGKDLTAESATYGNDICFPGHQPVTLANGEVRALKQLKAGDRILTRDTHTGVSKIAEVEKVLSHEPKNYAITRILVTRAMEQSTAAGLDVRLSARVLEATPNHPIETQSGRIEAGQVSEGDRVLCFMPASNAYESFTVVHKEAFAGGEQRVYNLVTRDGGSFIMNDVVVLEK